MAVNVSKDEAREVVRKYKSSLKWARDSLDAEKVTFSVESDGTLVACLHIDASDELAEVRDDSTDG